MTNFLFFTATGAGTTGAPGTVAPLYQAAGSNWDVIGGGGGGGMGAPNTHQATGGGGGGFSRISNVTWTASQNFSIGTGGAGATVAGTGSAGTSTWVRIDGGAGAPTTTAQGTLANPGAGGPEGQGVSTNGGAGGSTTGAVGTITNAGGNGGLTLDATAGCTGGGGAGGQGGTGGGAGADNDNTTAFCAGTGGGANGGGGAGVTNTTGTTTGTAGGTSITTGNQTGTSGGAGGTIGGAGGTPTNGAGGGGGGGSTSATAAGAAGAGGPGTEYDSSHGSGGGGGGGGASTSTGASTVGGAGGLYGGGGGAGGVGASAAASNGGAGAQGILVIAYTPSGGTNPFLPGDDSKPIRIRGRATPDIGLNPNIFTNPFPIFNGDQSRSRSIRWLAYPKEGLNPNLQTNPFPFFNGDQSSSRSTRWLPFPDPAYNPNLFTNPYPFFNGDQSSSRAVYRTPTFDAPYNQNLYTVTVVANPFFAAEVFQVFRPRGQPWPDVPFNPNLFTNPSPFNQYDWSKPVRVPQARLEINQALNINIQSNFFPFNQFDYNKPFFPVVRPYPQDGINSNLFTNPVPVLNPDSSRVGGFQPRAFFEQPYNPNLYVVVVVVNPFIQTDWTPAHKPPTTTAPEATFNPNLFANPVPFNQFEYPRARKVPQAAFDLSFSLNINLPIPTPPAPPPFIAYVPPIFKPPASKPDTSSGFILTRPVVGAQYRLLVDHYLLGPLGTFDIYYPGGTIVTEGLQVPFGWVPTIAVEPLNGPAIQAYWNAGPPHGAQSAQDLFPFPIAQYLPPGASIPIGTVKVFWQQLPGQPDRFVLTGAGAILGPK